MNRFLNTLAIVALLFTSGTLHAQKTFADALEMNNYLIAPNDSLYKKGQTLGRAVGMGYSTKDFSGVLPAKKAIIKYATEQLEELRKVKDQYGSEEFRKGIMDFLEYEVDVMKNKTPLLDKLSTKSTDGEVKAAIDEMMAGSKDESKFLEKVALMQSRFAEKNGFTVGLPEEIQDYPL